MQRARRGRCMAEAFDKLTKAAGQVRCGRMPGRASYRLADRALVSRTGYSREILMVSRFRGCGSTSLLRLRPCQLGNVDAVGLSSIEQAGADGLNGRTHHRDVDALERLVNGHVAHPAIAADCLLASA